MDTLKESSSPNPKAPHCQYHWFVTLTTNLAQSTYSASRRSSCLKLIRYAFVSSLFWHLLELVHHHTSSYLRWCSSWPDSYLPFSIPVATLCPILSRSWSPRPCYCFSDHFSQLCRLPCQSLNQSPVNFSVHSWAQSHPFDKSQSYWSWSWYRLAIGKRRRSCVCSVRGAVFWMETSYRWTRPGLLEDGGAFARSEMGSTYQKVGTHQSLSSLALIDPITTCSATCPIT